MQYEQGVKYWFNVKVTIENKSLEVFVALIKKKKSSSATFKMWEVTREREKKQSREYIFILLESYSW